MAKILVIAPALIPSVNIGVLRPLIFLKLKKEIKLRVNVQRYSPNFLIERNIRWADIIVFCRNTEYSDIRLIELCEIYGKKYIYEIDDNFFKIPLTTGIGRYHRYYFRLHALKLFLNKAESVRVFSEQMLRDVSEYTDNVNIVPTYFDTSLVSKKSRKKLHDKIRIVYPTGRIDEPKLEKLVFNAIKKLLEKYGEKIEFCLYRNVMPEIFDGLSNVQLLKGEISYEKFIHSFSAEKFDIGIAPGIDSDFFKSKTNNKYREFAACQIAGVYSDCAPYSECIQSGDNGLLAEFTSESWFESLSKLVDSSELRQKIARNAKRDIDLNYTFDAVIQSWRLDIKDVKTAENRIIKAKSTRRIERIFIIKSVLEKPKLTEDIFHETALLSGIAVTTIEPKQINVSEAEGTLFVFSFSSVQDLYMLDYANMLDQSTICYDFTGVSEEEFNVREIVKDYQFHTEALILHDLVDTNTESSAYISRKSHFGVMSLGRFNDTVFSPVGHGAMIIDWIGFQVPKNKITGFKTNIIKIIARFGLSRKYKMVIAFINLKFRNKV